MKSRDDDKNIEDDFPLSEQWYISILDSINDGVLAADKSLIVRYINPEYTKITGISRDQIIGCNLLEKRPGAVLPRVIKTGKSLEGIYRREGDREYVVDMAPIIINGETIGGVSIVKDITEVQQLTEQLRKFETKATRLKSFVDQIYRAKYSFQDIVGNSLPIQDTRRLAERVARGHADILISGESGTGKEVFAQAIHNASGRKNGPFVAVNCAAIAPSLIESELFGYDEGAFTGAKKGGKLGLFEIANGGTIFLDEIAELSLELQAKLLRVLQERTIRRVGESGELQLDIRVISATNRDLKIMIEKEKFRADLYYRLNVLNIELPTLRDRTSDINILIDEFILFYSKKIGRNLNIDQDVINVLLQHDWPGNVRELKNVVEHAVYLCENNVITVYDLPKCLLKYKKTEAVKDTLEEMVQAFERRTIETMFENYGSDLNAKRKIAQELGISLATLYNKIKH